MPKAASFPQSQVLQEFLLNLEVITPVSIGADHAKDLSPYIDVIVEEDQQQVVYLDPRMIEQRLAQHPQETQQYLEEMALLNNNRSEANLKAFLTERLGLNIDQGEGVKYRLPYFGMQAEKKQNILAHVKTAGKPFIPGSSLKGAFRTVLLYHWFTQDPEGRETMEEYDEILPQGLELATEIKQLASLDRKTFGKEERARKRQLAKKLDKLKKQIFKEASLFGSSPPRKGSSLDSQYIRFSDTSPVSLSQLGIYRAGRVRLTPLPKGKKGGKEIPQIREALIPGTQLNFSLSFLPRQLLTTWVNTST